MCIFSKLMLNIPDIQGVGKSVIRFFLHQAGEEIMDSRALTCEMKVCLVRCWSS